MIRFSSAAAVVAMGVAFFSAAASAQTIATGDEVKAAFADKTA